MVLPFERARQETPISGGFPAPRRLDWTVSVLDSRILNSEIGDLNPEKMKCRPKSQDFCGKVPVPGIILDSNQPRIFFIWSAMFFGSMP